MYHITQTKSQLILMLFGNFTPHLGTNLIHWGKNTIFHKGFLKYAQKQNIHRYVTGLIFQCYMNVNC